MIKDNEFRDSAVKPVIQIIIMASESAGIEIAAAKKRFQFKVVPNYGITTKDAEQVA